MFSNKCPGEFTYFSISSVTYLLMTFFILINILISPWQGQIGHIAASDQFPVQLEPPYAGSEQLPCLSILCIPQAGHSDQGFQGDQMPFT